MEIVTSRQNPAIKLARSLGSKKHRNETGLFLAEGEQQLERARAASAEPQYVFSTKPLAPWGSARRLLVNESLMGAITGRDNPPPIIALFQQRWSDVPPVPSGAWLILDGLRDPGNLGTIIRTADAVAASGIILSGDGCDPWSPECVRAATGSIFAMPLARAETTSEVIARWPGETVAAMMNAPDDYRRAYEPPTLLVIGCESSGLAPVLANACSTQVRIPMPGGTESLNAAVAAALLLYEIHRASL